jgi:hypothetical protein
MTAERAQRSGARERARSADAEATRQASVEPEATRHAVLIAGVPRSGTTWVGKALGATDGAVYVNEPDGDHDPFAFRARLGRGVAPALAPGDRDENLERLWQGALAGGRYAGTPRDRAARAIYRRTPVRDRWEAWLGGKVSFPLRASARLAVPRVGDVVARHVVVKSVRAELMLEWVADRFTPRVLVVERDPLNVLASWIELDFVRDPREAAAVADHARRAWNVSAPGPHEPQLVQQAFSFGVLASALRDAASRHPDWTVVTHEHLCVDTVARFATLAAELGLEWGDAARAYVAASDTAGAGYETRRPTAQQPSRWRERLDNDQIATIRATLARFPTDLLCDAE